MILKDGGFLYIRKIFAVYYKLFVFNFWLTGIWFHMLLEHAELYYVRHVCQPVDVLWSWSWFHLIRS